MQYRVLGKTDLKVSVLGFGCGGVGGLMVGDDYANMVRSVEKAVDAGINYFDTAQLYGSGRSEENLGKILNELRPDVVVGTKVRLSRFEPDMIEKDILEAAETSLRRLRKERLDLFQLHNALCLEGGSEKGWVNVQALPLVVKAFQKLQAAGKIRYWGLNGIGETSAIHQGLAGAPADTIQVCYNLLNPSAWNEMPENTPFQNYRGLIQQAVDRQAGVIAFRILAGGALTAQLRRHPLAARYVDPIASASEYAADVELAKHFEFFVTTGWTASMAEAAIRFAVSRPEISTLLIGFSSVEQIEEAVYAVESGPLPQEALDRLPDTWRSY